jgi:hypothetical protein
MEGNTFVRYESAAFSRRTPWERHFELRVKASPCESHTDAKLLPTSSSASPSSSSTTGASSVEGGDGGSASAESAPAATVPTVTAAAGAGSREGMDDPAPTAVGAMATGTLLASEATPTGGSIGGAWDGGGGGGGGEGPVACCSTTVYDWMMLGTAGGGAVGGGGGCAAPISRKALDALPADDRNCATEAPASSSSLLGAVLPASRLEPAARACLNWRICLSTLRMLASA